MILFSNYLHISYEKNLSDYLLPISKEILNEIPETKEYVNGKTTYFLKKYPNQYTQNLQPFYDFIFKNSMEYLKVMEVNTNEYNVRLNSLWFSEMHKNGSHELHSHGTQDDISGNFYIHLEEGSSNIKFYRHDFLYNNFVNIKVEKYNSHNSIVWNIPPEKGMLLMWQSNIPHSVEQNNSNSRITLSFNMSIIKNKKN